MECVRSGTRSHRYTHSGRHVSRVQSFTFKVIKRFWADGPGFLLFIDDLKLFGHVGLYRTLCQSQLLITGLIGLAARCSADDILVLISDY